MSNFIVNAALGQFVYRYGLHAGGDSIVVVLVQSAGVPSDANYATYTTLSQVWSGGGAEANFTNYTRINLTSSSITITPGATTTVAIPSQVWNSAGSPTSNSLASLLTCYQPASSSLDSAILLMSKHDFVGSIAGGTLTATITTIAGAS